MSEDKSNHPILSEPLPDLLDQLAEKVQLLDEKQRQFEKALAEARAKADSALKLADAAFKLAGTLNEMYVAAVRAANAVAEASKAKPGGE